MAAAVPLPMPLPLGGKKVLPMQGGTWLMRRPGKAGEYLVQWEGYDASFNTWEPRANLTGCDKLLAEYNAIHCLK
ncbi:uncharacterized protein HaLaN_11027 [Haematococcus lacustris]|uniref:Chromo domain-containing protein n=1 Tax=Haematococcus lacustris TaxID=44745 RepID=A0A699YXB3_HAELA|nr:uncharacterized protein HaLaN_11027 [Haematococcus lacustris]